MRDDVAGFPPIVITPPEPPRRRRTPWGPLAVGMAAVPLSFFAFGVQGLLAAFLAVASWWTYKF